MDMLSKSLGICITCRHRTHCLSFQNGLQAERPIWSCDEYEHNDAGMADVVSLPFRPEADSGDDILQAAGRQKTKGLCLNCVNLSSCKMPAAREGVWHCEEYA